MNFFGNCPLSRSNFNESFSTALKVEFLNTLSNKAYDTLVFEKVLSEVGRH